jgi:hypothetical protein
MLTVFCRSGFSRTVSARTHVPLFCPLGRSGTYNVELPDDLGFANLQIYLAGKKKDPGASGESKLPGP